MVNCQAPYRSMMGMKGHPVMAHTGGKYTGNAHGGWNSVPFQLPPLAVRFFSKKRWTGGRIASAGFFSLAHHIRNQKLPPASAKSTMTQITSIIATILLLGCAHAQVNANKQLNCVFLHGSGGTPNYGGGSYGMSPTSTFPECTKINNYVCISFMRGRKFSSHT